MVRISRSPPLRTAWREIAAIKLSLNSSGCGTSISPLIWTFGSIFLSTYCNGCQSVVSDLKKGSYKTSGQYITCPVLPQFPKHRTVTGADKEHSVLLCVNWGLLLMIHFLTPHAASLQCMDHYVHRKQPCKAKKSIMVYRNTTLALLLQFFSSSASYKSTICWDGTRPYWDFLGVTSRENKDDLG